MTMIGKNFIKATGVKNFLSIFLILAFIFNFFLPAVHVHAEEHASLDVSSCCQNELHYHPYYKPHNNEHNCTICQNLLYNFCDTPQNLELAVATNCFESVLANKNSAISRTYLLTSLQPQAP